MVCLVLGPPPHLSHSKLYVICYDRTFYEPEQLPKTILLCLCKEIMTAVMLRSTFKLSFSPTYPCFCLSLTLNDRENKKGNGKGN